MAIPFHFRPGNILFCNIKPILQLIVDYKNILTNYRVDELVTELLKEIIIYLTACNDTQGNSVFEKG